MTYKMATNFFTQGDVENCIGKPYLEFGDFTLSSGAELRRFVCGTKISTTQFIIESNFNS